MRPQPSRTTVDPVPSSAVAAIHTEDHVVWDEPDAVISAYTDFLEVGEEDAVTMEDV